MRIVLNIRTGPAAGKKIVLQPTETATVGRGYGSTVAIPDDALLSTTHFHVVCRPQECILEDLESRNGTSVNGRRVSRATLSDGDRISAGEALVEVTIEKTGSATGAPLRDVLQKSGPLFAVFDAARRPPILPLLDDDIDGEVQSLYDGESAVELAKYAPYLASLPAGSELLDQMIEQGWGDSWGIYLTSRKPLAEIRHHLRQFLIVRKSDGKEAYFRFYDPRVLRVYLEGCSGADVRTLFGPIDA